MFPLRGTRLPERNPASQALSAYRLHGPKVAGLAAASESQNLNTKVRLTPGLAQHFALPLWKDKAVGGR